MKECFISLTFEKTKNPWVRGYIKTSLKVLFLELHHLLCLTFVSYTRAYTPTHTQMLALSSTLAQDAFLLTQHQRTILEFPCATRCASICVQWCRNDHPPPTPRRQQSEFQIVLRGVQSRGGVGELELRC